MNPNTPILTIQDLTVSFDTDEGSLTAAESVSFTIGRGEAIGLVGESGSGKSITALSIMQLIPSPPGRITDGQILFHGVDLLKMSPRDLRTIRGAKISMIFQEPMTALSPLHRVGEQLVETLRIHQTIDRAQAWSVSEEWLRKVGIPDTASRMYAYPFELSGGMRQRVMIAMALMLHPELVIADEPTTALDSTIQAQIFELMEEIRSDQESLLLITHDMGVVWETCDRVVVMYAGKVVETGNVSDVFGNPLHPYTRALLESMPSMTHTGTRLKTIPGSVPSPLHLPPGCRFCDRCAFVKDVCRKAHPALRETAPGRQVACYLFE